MMPPTVQAVLQAVETAAPAAIRIEAATDPARFIVGQDRCGHWVAVEVHGRAGGLFRSREAAIGFAADETGHRPDAVLLSGTRIELRL
ncbi:hypothetical protein [Methylobacterium dankookense]|uniref:Uncharacterized protein n=1 Tax=Methylobacterium dankookense TaxID=560405 RepID=A0A564G3P2_9HYPH|nr:hypothetical protein IFDJLNFL_3375 [Methylobacterium dankookense]VUF14211.1 hypothetical protein MTDSW087_03928 [Methylobacterium dankookense]